MSNTTVGTALAQVADILSSSDYSDKEVFIIIPKLGLQLPTETSRVLKRRDLYRRGLQKARKRGVYGIGMRTFGNSRLDICHVLDR
jgi:hypothetical protein